MRHFFLLFVWLLFLLPLGLLILFTAEEEICFRETQEALKAAETETLRLLAEVPYREIAGDEEMTETLLFFLLPRLREGTVTLRIYGRDLAYGFVDAEVILERPFPLFGPIRAVSRRAAFVDVASAYASGE